MSALSTTTADVSAAKTPLITEVSSDTSTKAPFITDLKDEKQYNNWYNHPLLLGAAVKSAALAHKFLSLGYEKLTDLAREEVAEKHLRTTEKLKEMGNLMTIYVTWCLDPPYTTTEVLTIRHDDTLADLKHKLEQSSAFYSKQNVLALKQSSDQKSFHAQYWTNKRIVYKARSDASIMDDTYLFLGNIHTEFVVLSDNVKNTEHKLRRSPGFRSVEALPPSSSAPLPPTASLYTAANLFDATAKERYSGGDSPISQDDQPPSSGTASF